MKQEKWLLCPVCGNSYKCSTNEYVYYQRARRTDAEPINLRTIIVCRLFVLELLRRLILQCNSFLGRIALQFV